MVVNDLVKIDESFHARLIERLLLLLLLRRPNLHHIPVLLLVLSQLLLEGAHVLLLLLFDRSWLQLVDSADKLVHADHVAALVFLSIVHCCFQVAIEEVKARHSVPGLQHLSLEDHNFVLVHHAAQLLFPPLLVLTF